jgi:hypothetical protein
VSEAWLRSIDLSVDQPAAQRLAVLGAARCQGARASYLNPRALERDGVVIRSVYPSAPVRIEYRLSTSAPSLLEPLAPLRHWRSSISAMSCWNRRPTMSATKMQRAPALIKLPPAERSACGIPSDSQDRRLWAPIRDGGSVVHLFAWSRPAERGPLGVVSRSSPTGRRPKRWGLAAPRSAGVAELWSATGLSSTGRRPDRPRCSSRRGCPRTM